MLLAYIDDALVQTGENLKTIKYMDMPAFGIVENLVEEEVSWFTIH